jgi:hypothetical protein
VSDFGDCSRNVQKIASFLNHDELIAFLKLGGELARN